MAAAPKTATFSLNDRGVRAVLYQIITIGSVILVAAYLVSNTMNNLETRQIQTGFGFLSQESGFAIAESLIDYAPSDTYGRAMVVGFLNTVKVSLLGIVLATIIGTVIGVARLSSNWMIAKLMSVYVNLVRNIPVLLQIILWHTVLTNTLPHPRQSISLFDSIFLSKRGFYMPFPVDHLGWTLFLIAIPVAVVIAVMLNKWATRRQEMTGEQFPAILAGIGIVVFLPILAWAVGGAPTAFDVPALKGFNMEGGARVTPEFAAVLIGLTVYTSAFIAEVVRSGILAVSHGQTEAGRSLGLSEGVIMRKIILPQALRVIVPPTTNQYLNLTKNSSLAVAVGYPDLVSTGNTTLNQTGQAIEAILIMMTVYLATSLSTSLFMNWYNKKIQLVER